MLVPNRDCPTSSFAEKPAAEKRLGKRSRKLMKAACAGLLGAGATLAGGEAQAFTFDESAVGDFSEDFDAANLLPPGVTILNGSSGSNDDDYVEVAELTPGSTFGGTLSLVGGVGSPVTLQLFDSSEEALPLDSGANVSNDRVRAGRFDPPLAFSATVPSDGKVLAFLRVFEGSGAYTVSLDAAEYVIPEPGAAGLAAMGAVALLGRRRKDDRNDA